MLLASLRSGRRFGWLLGWMLLLAASPARGGEPLVLKIWPGDVPGEQGDVGPERLLEPRGERPVQRLTDVSEPTIAVYLPKENATGAAVLICPGGGYSILAMDLEGEEVAAWLNRQGVAGIVLKYRVPRRANRPKHEAPLQDAQRAMSLVRRHAGDWGIDPQRIGILGFSAGGHLAAVAATNFDRRAYEKIDEVDTTNCRPDFAVLIYPAYLLAEKGSDLAEEVRPSEESPPIFFAHAADDRIGPENSIELFRALRKAGVAAELHIYASGGHGFGLRPSPHTSSHWPEQAAAWMKSRGLLEKR